MAKIITEYVSNFNQQKLEEVLGVIDENCEVYVFPEGKKQLALKGRESMQPGYEKDFKNKVFTIF